MTNKTVVIIPTYNERENLPIIVQRLLSTDLKVDILIADDSSPDGTGEIADGLAAEHDSVHVLHRTAKEGLLAAYREAFEWSLERGYEIICQMDADGSHAPEQLHRLLGEIEDGADLVIGSRYIEGGEVKNWPRERYVLSKVGNQYISLLLGGDVSDMTAGYRAFRREVLEQIDLYDLSDKGYIFQVDIAHRVEQAGFDVREVPITFEDRTLGESKLDASFASKSLVEVTKWGVKEKCLLARNLVQELKGLAAYEFDRSRFNGIGKKFDAAAEQAVGFVGEALRLVKHSLRK